MRMMYKGDAVAYLMTELACYLGPGTPSSKRKEAPSNYLGGEDSRELAKP